MKVHFKGEQGRGRDFFGYDWRFALTDSLEKPDENQSWREVQLPHDWSVDYPVEEAAPSCGSGGYARTGIGWYTKRFYVEHGEEELVSLYFEGVYMNCDLFLNGSYAGGHIYGYTSFEVPVTKLLRPGENEILIRVDNSHQPGSRWYTGSGITRDVYLQKTGKLHIPTWGVSVTTPEIGKDQATVCVETTIRGGFEKENLRLVTQLVDRDGTICAWDERAAAPKEESVCRQSIELKNPRIWELSSPCLYTAVSRLYLGDTPVDEVSTRFGVRKIAIDREQGFLLNGEKVILRGVCLHHDGGCVGAAVPPAVWERRLKKCKAMGVNALRMSHNPPDPALLDLADTMGFVVMDEAFDEWQAMKGKEFGSNTHESRGYSEWFSTCWEKDMTAMVLRDRNHPSIVMWSIGNEVREQVIPGGWEVAKRLAGLCHAIDPTRPITQACDQVKAEPVPAYNEFLEELDIVGVNYTDRWRERTETFYDEEKREHPDWVLMGTEDVSVGGKRGDYRLQTEESVWSRTSYYAKMLKAEKLWKFIRTRPYVVGSFMWTGIDYLGECFWPEKGACAGVMDTCGFEKDGYYFYQSLWTKEEPVLYACPHLNLELKKGEIYPFIVYTNCFSVELFVDGVSYGVKAYEFPAQGMTKQWSHFDRPQSPITTSDLHLSWDVPYTRGEVVVIGRDNEGREIARKRLVPAGSPQSLCVKADRNQIAADGRDVVQLELSLLDGAGLVVPHQDLPVSLEIEGGTLLGMDNGDPACQTLYQEPCRDTYRGMAYAIVRGPREAGTIKITATAKGLPPVTVEIQATA